MAEALRNLAKNLLEAASGTIDATDKLEGVSELTDRLGADDDRLGAEDRLGADDRLGAGGGRLGANGLTVPCRPLCSADMQGTKPLFGMMMSSRSVWSATAGGVFPQQADVCVGNRIS